MIQRGGFEVWLKHGGVFIEFGVDWGCGERGFIMELIKQRDFTRGLN